MNANEPTAEEIRDALDFCIEECAEEKRRHRESVLRHIRDVLLANPDRVRALLDLTYFDLSVGVAQAHAKGERMTSLRFGAAACLHPDDRMRIEVARVRRRRGGAK